MNLKKLMFVSLLVLSNSIQAQDHIGWGNPTNPGRDPWDTRPSDPRDPRHPRDPRDPWENHREDLRDVELQINQYFQGQARFDLLQDYYTRSQLQGKRIKEVTIIASTEHGNGQARLLTNGQSLESAQTVARQMSRVTFRVDPFANSIDQSLRNLELEMRGRFYVERAIFSFVKDNGPIGPGPGIPSQQTEVLRQQLNEQIQGEGGLHLFRLFNLAAERQGQVVKRVTIIARSQRGSAQAQLHINDQSSGLSQTIGMSSSRLAFDLSAGQRIGRELQGLRLQVRGNVVIEEVTLEIEKSSSFPGPGPGPILERRIEQVINQRVYDTSGINLTALMRIDRRHEERIVDSVELVLRQSDYGARLKLCQQVSGQWQTVNCGNIVTLSPGSQVVRLTSVNFAKLSELSLSVRMGMIDIERIIINLR